MKASVFPVLSLDLLCLKLNTANEGSLSVSV